MKIKVTVPSKLTGVDKYAGLRFNDGVAIYETDDPNDPVISYARSQSRWKVEVLEPHIKEIEKQETENASESEKSEPENVDESGSESEEDELTKQVADSPESDSGSVEKPKRQRIQHR